MIRWNRQKYNENDKAYHNDGSVESHRGLVLETYHESVRIMFSVWETHQFAVVWDGEKPATMDVTWARMTVLGLPEEKGVVYEGRASVDATDEVRAAYAEWKKADDERRAEEARKREQERREAEARVPRKGRWVKVAKGRKFPKGLEGFCFWTGDGRYGPRAGVQVGDEDGEVIWIALGNLEAVPAA
jgi:hypothetical protein